MTEFGATLRRWRLARSLTQEELAERARLAVNAVGALERGERRRPYPHTVRALAVALELDDDQSAQLAALVPRPAITRSRDAEQAAPLAGGRRSVAWLPVDDLVLGREPEIVALSALVDATHRRVITLTGPGGVGKTTLAREVAARVSPSTRTVVVVELDAIMGSDGVMPAIAGAVGVPEAGGLSVEHFASHLAGRRLLLVLDNLEHLLAAASDIALLVSLCPDMVVLATSRAPLRVRGEQEVRVAPLEGSATEALFRDRMAGAGHTLGDDDATRAAVTQLCDRTDGLPLAVELTAAAAARLGPVTLAARIDTTLATGRRDAPARQHSMTATLAWSHDLLAAPARALLARLSVCVGGFSTALAEALGDGTRDTTLAELAELVEQSMVARSGDVEGVERFRLLEPIRRNAADRLNPAETSAARERLATAVIAEVVDLGVDLEGSGFVPAARLLEAEMGNMRVTAEVLLDQGRGDELAAVLWSGWRFFAARGHALEAVGWARRLHERPMGDSSRARGLVARGALAAITGRHVEAREVLAEAHSLAQRIDDPELIAATEVLAVSAAALGGDRETARTWIAMAEDSAERSGYGWWRTHARIHEGELALMAGETHDAERVLRHAEIEGRRLGNPLAMASALFLRGVTGLLEDRIEEAGALLAETAELAIETPNLSMLSYVAGAVAGIAARRQDPSTAAWLFGAAATYTSEYAVVLIFPAARRQLDRDHAAVRENLGAEAFAKAWRAGRAASTFDVLEAVRAVTAQG